MVLWESYTNVSPAGPALPVVDDGDKGQQQDAGRAEPLHLLLPEEDWPPQVFNQSHAYQPEALVNKGFVHAYRWNHAFQQQQKYLQKEIFQDMTFKNYGIIK